MAELVADTLREFIKTHLGDVEDDQSIAHMTCEDAERCLKLMLASQMPDEETARFVCGCIDPNRVYGLELFRDARVDPRVYRYIFENAQVNAQDDCLKQFERISGVSGSPQKVLRAFHAQFVKNFRDEVLDIAGGQVTIGNDLYARLRAASSEEHLSREVIADLWQHHVSFPFFENGAVVITAAGRNQGEMSPSARASAVAGRDNQAPPKAFSRVPPVPLANGLETTERSKLLEQLEPVLLRYCVEAKLPKHLWHYDFTVNQCIQVALGSTVTDLHRDQPASHLSSLKFKYTQEELTRLLEYHLSTRHVDELVRDNAQTRLYHLLGTSGDVVKNPTRFLAGLIAHHYTSPETLPERYRQLCPTVEPVIQKLIK